MNQTLHPCLKHHSIISELCAPLQNLGVTFFGYTALDSAGNAYCLGSKTDYAEQYLNREHVKKDILVQPKNAKSKYEYDFWDFQDLDADQEDIYKMAAEFDQSHTLSITQHHNHLSHSFHFSGRQVDESLNQRLLEKMDSLHLFIDLFLEKLRTVKELTEVYHYSTAIDQESILDNRVSVLVKQTPTSLDLSETAQNTLNFKATDYLTYNERDCLRWLASGKSAQMISEINRVSRKTVERHIASIKEKLGCYTLFQMGIRVVEKNLSTFLPAITVN